MTPQQDKDTEENLELKIKRITPAQDKLKEEINKANSQAVNLKQLENSGFSSVSRKEVIGVIQKRNALEKKLKRLQQNVVYQKKDREKKKAKIEEACAANPETRDILKSINRETAGKPRIGK